MLTLNSRLKMFKYRIKKWGFRKYLRAEETQQALEKLASGQKVELPIIQGRQIGSRRLQCNMKRANTDEGVLGKASAARTRAAMASRFAPRVTGQLRAPDPYHTWGSAWQSMRTYIAFKCQGGSWPRLDGDETSEWWAGIDLAMNEVQRHPNSTSAFAQLDTCFSSFVSVIRSEGVTLIWAIYMTVLRLSAIGEDLTQLFIRYVIHLSSIVFGRGHPFTRHWALVQKMEAGLRPTAFSSFLRASFEEAFDSAKTGTPFRMFLVLAPLGYMCESGAIGLDEAVARLRAVAQSPVTYRDAPQQLPSTAALSETMLAMRDTAVGLDIKKTMMSRSWCDKPLDIMMQWVSLAKHQPDFVVDTVSLLGIMVDCRGTLGSAERYFEVALQLLLDNAPDDHERILSTCSRLEGVRLRRGDIEGVKAARLLAAPSAAILASREGAATSSQEEPTPPTLSPASL